jgi:PiT family inorganic phosphate transporter
MITTASPSSWCRRMLGFLLGALLMLSVSWLFCRATPLRDGSTGSGSLQLGSSGLYSLGHGGNDAQKTMGIIWLLLIADRAQRPHDRTALPPTG